MMGDALGVDIESDPGVPGVPEWRAQGRRSSFVCFGVQTSCTATGRLRF